MNFTKAKARTPHKPGEMNKLEAAWGAELQKRKLAGLIQDYKFESVKLKLATNTTYTPDFFVVGQLGEIIFYEVKGHWEQSARIKTKVAAELYPWFSFIAVTRDKGIWKQEEF